MTRLFSSISVATTLESGISNSATSITVAAGTGSALLGGVTINSGDQFTLALDPDTQNEEIIFATANTSDTFTVSRGQAGSSAVAHSAGATVKHVLTGSDLTWFESNTSPVASWGVRGSSSGTTTLVANAVASGTLTLPAITDTIVSLTATQTLTNKTISAASNTLTGVITETGTQTLTNKTLTSPIIDTPALTLSTTTATTEGRIAWEGTNDKIIVGDGSSTKEFTPNTITINAQTGTTYTLVLTDRDKLVTLNNGSAITVTVPLNSSVAYATGTIINIQQIGAGQVTVQGASGVTVTSTGSTSTTPKTRVQYSAASIIKTGTDSWTVIGDIV
jgi:hypothetical protein